MGPINRSGASTVPTLECAPGMGSVGSGVSTGRAPFDYPAGIALAPNGDCIVANSFEHSICRLTRGGMAETIAGTGSPGLKDGNRWEALFYYPEAVAVDELGVIYVADCDNHAIRVIAPTGEVTTLAGSGESGHRDAHGREAAFSFPRGVALDRAASLLVADTMCVRRVTLDGEVSTVTACDFWIEAHGGEFGFLGGIAVDKNGDIFLTAISLHALLIVDRDGQVSVLAGGNGAGFSDGWGRSASFDKPRGLAVDPSGRIFIADSNNHAVRVLLPNGKVETLTGQDLGIEGGLSHPAGVAVGSDGYLYVSDQFNNCVHRALV